MNDRDKKLAEGLNQLHNQLAGIYKVIDTMQSLVPSFDFDTAVASAERSDEALIEGMTASPPSERIDIPAHERGTYAMHQIPMFEMPINIVFENVTINGEVVDLEELEHSDGSDS